MISSIEEGRRNAAVRAVEDYVKSNSIVGLGTGRTVRYALDAIAFKLQSGSLTNIKGIPTSEATRKIAEELKIPLVSLDEVDCVDVAIDGADEVDDDLKIIKGRGAALLREKMVAQLAKQFVIIVDDAKLQRVGRFGTSGSLPVEVVQFCCHTTMRRVLEAAKRQSSGCQAKIRECSTSSKPVVTDNGNYIVDIYAPADSPIKDPHALASELEKIAGVIEHGIFLDIATACVAGMKDGSTRKFGSKKQA